MINLQPVSTKTSGVGTTYLHQPLPRSHKLKLAGAKAS